MHPLETAAFSNADGAPERARSAGALFLDMSDRT
jgi:hypothetical protein